MGAKRTEYQIVGSYMDGKEVTAYHLQSIETGKAGRYSREQVAYLVGRDQITNCVGQIYQDKLLLRGKGMSLEDLPVQQEDGTLKRTDNIGKVRRGTSAADAMEQWMIVGTIKSGKNTVGYVVQNAGCGIKRVKRQQVIELARAGKIGNARVQMYNGNELLRGVNVNLDELPSETVAPNNDNVSKAQDNRQGTLKKSNSSVDPSYPKPFNAIIQAYEKVENQLGLKKCTKFITVDEDSYRIDFESKTKPEAVMFITYYTNGSVTASYNEYNNGIEDEKSNNCVDASYLKVVFMWYASRLK